MDPAPDDKAPRAGQVLAQVVDGRLLRAIEGRVERRLQHDFTVETKLREPRLHLDPADWRAGIIAERTEREDLPYQLYEDMKEMTPQAILRDLYRPVYEAPYPEPDWCSAELLDPGARRGLTEARAARKRDPLPRIEPSTRALVAERRRRLAWLREPWKPAMADDAPRRPTATVPADDE